jgi:hypothetical protein
MEVFLHAWRRVEIVLAGLLIIASLACTGMVAQAMATSSLSTDEFGTVGTFSAKGPGRVLTDYRAPKNHIFFNLLNSVLPSRGSWNPARVRVLSIAATLLTALVIVGWTARRGQLFEGSVVLALWSLAPETLTLSMEARGYGFLGLFAALAAIGTIEYLRTARRSWLILLAVASVLGVYTVPSFLILVGPLLLLLWISRRTWETFLTGVISGAAMLILYAPVLGQVIAAFTGFHEDREVLEFGSSDSLARAVRLYLQPCDNWEAIALLAILLLAPFAVARWRPAGERLGPCLVAASCGFYFLTLMLLRTPPLRVAACGLLPAALVGILALGAGLRRIPLARPIAITALAGMLLVASVRAISAFDFQPAENWTLAARAIDTAFPPTMKIEFGRYAKYLKQTLPDSETRAAPYDAAKFADGTLVVADAGNKWAEGRRFVAPAGTSRVVEWTIPGRIRDIVLTFRKPENNALPASALKPIAEDTMLKIPPAAGARSLVLKLNRPVTARDLTTDAPGALLAGDALVVPLTPSGPKTIRLQAHRDDLVLTDAWIF